MKYEFEILQIDSDKVEEGTMDLSFWPCPDSKKIDLNKNGYQSVYRSIAAIKPEKENGNVELCEILERLFHIFNIEHPSDFRGHSLSMSDIIKIEVNDQWQYHYCDRFGFTQVEVVA